MRTLLLFISLLGCLSINAKDLVVVSTNNNDRVKSGTWHLYNEKNDSISSGTISDSGIISLPETDFAGIEINAEKYSPKYIRKKHLTNDTIYVSQTQMLDELVVIPKKMSDLGNRISYRIPMEDMNRYTNFYQALNEIPNLTVLPGGGAFYEGNENTIFLLNGVETTVSELQTIAKEDISKIDVYRNPPARFVSRGSVSVINVITKSNLTGGNVGLNVDQAFYPLIGVNSASVFYNYRRSRFSVQYNGENSHYNKYRQNELLDYEFDGVRYVKEKIGKDSNHDHDFNSLLLSYQNNKANNYLYNLKVGMEWDWSNDELNQEVHSNNAVFNALNILRTKYNKYNIANYFEKRIGDSENGGTFLGNINFQHYDTRYKSSYEEFTDDATLNPLTSFSSYKTRLDGIFAEIQYEFPKSKIGYMSMAIYDSFHYSAYKDAVNPFHQTTNSTGGNFTWLGSWKKMLWNVRMGVMADFVSTSKLEKPYNIVIPYPSVYVGWKPNNSFIIGVTYKYFLNHPSIAQLSETNQWLDTRLVYHGNATLKPGKTHSLNLSGAFSNRYIYASLIASCDFSPNKICNQYLLTDRYMLETIVNLDTYREIGGTLDVTLMPLGNTKFTFFNRVILAEVRGKNTDYSWHGTRFQWMSVLSLNLTKWSVSAYYQFPGNIAEGQLIRPRPQCWSITAYYSPVRDLWVGLKWFMPLGKSFKESEHTVLTAPVYWEKENDIRDGANYIALQVSWNISFGKNQNRQRPQFGNGDNDSGILRK